MVHYRKIWMGVAVFEKVTGLANLKSCQNTNVKKIRMVNSSHLFVIMILNFGQEYVLPHFWRPFISLFQGSFFRKFFPNVWLVFKSGLLERVYVIYFFLLSPCFFLIAEHDDSLWPTSRSVLNCGCYLQGKNVHEGSWRTNALCTK